ncbi:MAG: UDP-3-O-acyl-N-acetylglucosamine deacetylase, partial [Elusimicrobia bacterium]|nr:UDP-3-O-acyl-N-acetylglucosamine deacetylase [Elusimicrobiota bacterium]
GEALRFKDEFVRHKILDLMGDLMLIGSPIRARLIAKRCGHGHNVKFMRALLEKRAAASVNP